MIFIVIAKSHMHSKAEIIKPQSIVILLDTIKLQAKKELTPEIQQSLVKIQAHCDAYYSDQSYYGNAALNRKILLDQEIAEKLRPEVIHYLFTNEPNRDSTLVRNQTPGGVGLRDAIYYGFQQGLQVIRLMPNNEKNYGPDTFATQQVSFRENTLRIAYTISEVAQMPCLVEDLNLDETRLILQYEFIINIIKKIEKNNRWDKFLHVPGYSLKDLLSQVDAGFDSLLNLLKVDLRQENLHSFALKLLMHSKAYLNSDVLHFLLDRAHLEVALVSKKKILFGDLELSYRELFQAIYWFINSQPGYFSSSVKEQFCLRLKLIRNDLHQRFKEEYDAALKEFYDHQRIESGLSQALSILESDASTAEKQIQATRKLRTLLSEYLSLPLGFTVINKPVRNYFEKVVTDVVIDYTQEPIAALHIDQLTANNLKLKIVINEYLLALGQTKKNNWTSILNFVDQIQQVRKIQSTPYGLLVLSPELIKNIYLSEDQTLIALFTKYFPIPSIEVFKGAATPEIIQERLTAQLATLNKLRGISGKIRHETSFLKIQRLFRKKELMKTRAKGIELRSQFHENPESKSSEGLIEEHKLSDQEIQNAIENADQPYTPQNCSPELKSLLLSIAEEITLKDLFQNNNALPIRHKTSASASINILNEGFKDKRTLTELYNKFIPGGTSVKDISEDSKFVSFSAGQICSTIAFEDEFEIYMDLKKLMSNPCMLFKFKDFGLTALKAFRTKHFNFSHLANQDLENQVTLECYANASDLDSNSDSDSDDSEYDSSSFKYQSYYISERCLKTAVSHVPYHSLMTTNFENLAQIIVLNFFRFVDNLKDYDSKNEVILEEDKQRTAIYDKLESLTKEEIKTELIIIGQIILQTAEFCFYKTHQIDFDKVICFESSNHTIHIDRLLEELKRYDWGQLKYHTQRMENLWKSYRFLGYLIFKALTGNFPAEAQAFLKKMQSHCQPPWYLNSQFRFLPDKCKPVEEKETKEVKEMEPLGKMRCFIKTPDGR